jgi:hypothetical protein
MKGERVYKRRLIFIDPKHLTFHWFDLLIDRMIHLTYDFQRRSKVNNKLSPNKMIRFSDISDARPGNSSEDAAWIIELKDGNVFQLKVRTLHTHALLEPHSLTHLF